MTTASRFEPAEIVGGQKAPSPIPWQVSLQRFGGAHFCGGIILDTFTILSAAHCFKRDSADGYSIRAGSTKWSSGGQVRYISHFLFNISFHIQFNVLILFFLKSLHLKIVHIIRNK